MTPAPQLRGLQLDNGWTVVEVATRTVSRRDFLFLDEILRPLESSRDWYELPAVAEAAPVEFLRAGWAWVADTQAHALDFFEQLLRRGLNAAFRLLREIDIQPSDTPEPPRRERRRRRRG
jgi:hypothetical protein